MFPSIKKWIVSTGQEVHQNPLGFVFIFSSFCPEMVWMLHRKRNKGRRKSGFVFNYISFMEVAAPQFSADSLSIYTKVAEQHGKFFRKKLLLGLCKAAPLSRSSCITLHHAEPSSFPWSPTSISDTSQNWEWRQWNKAATERQPGIPSVCGSLSGVEHQLKGNYTLPGAEKMHGTGRWCSGGLHPLECSYMSCFYCRQLYHLLSQEAFCLTFLKFGRGPGIAYVLSSFKFCGE